MSRLHKCFFRTDQHRRKWVCIFLTLGYPSLRRTEQLIIAFEKIGVDFIELGFPFSDPLADGPAIQHSSDAALRRGTTFQDAFRLTKRLRQKGVRLPIIFFSYFNPIFHYGVTAFAKDAGRYGFDGVIIPDLLPDEAHETEMILKCRGLPLIYLIAPTTTPERMRWIARRSQEFVYYVSLRGVTGARKTIAPDVTARLKQVKQVTRKPVLVGFGVSSSGHVKSLCRQADGVIVGSAVINSIRRYPKNPDKTIFFVSSLVRAAKQAPVSFLAAR